jgi:hypothetical protein
MKIKFRPDEASMLQNNGWFQVDKEDGWSQVDDWLSKLRDDGPTEPASGSHAEPASGSHAKPASGSHAESSGHGDPGPGAPAETTAPAETAASQPDATVRPVIGDQLRMPIMWCEMGSCISWYSDPAALGEGDTRARAISAGWRIDALGRLACPGCQQTDPGFWASHRVVRWDRYTALARAGQITNVTGDRTDGTARGDGHDPRLLVGAATSSPQSWWYRQYPGAQMTSAGSQTR